MQTEELILNSYTFRPVGTYISSFGNVYVVVVKKETEFYLPNLQENSKRRRNGFEVAPIDKSIRYVPS